MEVKTRETIKIGKQIWATENFSVFNFRNGDIIPEAQSNEEWVAEIIKKASLVLL
jgi:hypothetical protein